MKRLYSMPCGHEVPCYLFYFFIFVILWCRQPQLILSHTLVQSIMRYWDVWSIKIRIRFGKILFSHSLSCVLAVHSHLSCKFVFSQEVKECAISCMSLVVSTFGDGLERELPACLPILVDRMGNGITRLTAVKVSF